MSQFKKPRLLICGVIAAVGLLLLLWRAAEAPPHNSAASQDEAVAATRDGARERFQPLAEEAAGADSTVDSVELESEGGPLPVVSSPSFKRDASVVARSESLAVKGFVLDSFGKEPVASARLSIAAAEREGASVEVASGEKGEFSLLLPSAQRYRLRAEADGYRPTVRSHFFVDRDVEDLIVWLDPLFSVRGVVLNERGERLPDASVDVKPGAGNPLRFVPNSATRTDEKGEFAYANLSRAGAFEFRAFSANHEMPSPVAIEVPEQDWVEIHMTSIPSEEQGMIYGFVVDSEGRFLSAHPIGLGMLFERFSHEILRSESNPDGSYQFGLVAAGRYDVHAYLRPEYANTASRSQSVLVKPGGRHRVDLTLEKAESVRGIVLAGDSDFPVEGARVTMNNEGSLGGVGFISGPDGEFRGDQLARGTVEIRVAHPDFQPFETQAVVPSERPVTVRLEGGLSLSGTLSTFQGAPVEAARLHLVSVTRDRMIRSALIQAVDGRFLLRGLPRDSYELKIELPEGAEGSVSLTLSESARIALLIDPKSGRVELHQ